MNEQFISIEIDVQSVQNATKQSNTNTKRIDVINVTK